ncbi:MAG: Na(+)-translocating NADH-quinone reductase subunit C [Methylococcales bacterium]
MLNENNAFVVKAKAYADKVLKLPNDSIEKTIAIAVAICLVGAVFVSVSAVALKPLQVANKELDMKRNILSVVDLLEDGATSDEIDEAFQQFETKIVDLATGDYIDDIDVAAYDQRKAAKAPDQHVMIDRADDLAKIKTRANYAKVYLLKEGDEINAVILPVHGYGLWSTMYGFLAVEGDGQTVIGINFYDQAETPGLGGEIVNPNWRALWKGKEVYNENGEPVLGLIKGTVDTSRDEAVNQVDGLAGATLTSVGVTNLVRYWMSSQGFSPYLEKIKSNEG